MVYKIPYSFHFSANLTTDPPQFLLEEVLLPGSNQMPKAFLWVSPVTIFTQVRSRHIDTSALLPGRHRSWKGLTCVLGYLTTFSPLARPPKVQVYLLLNRGICTPPLSN